MKLGAQGIVTQVKKKWGRDGNGEIKETTPDQKPVGDGEKPGAGNASSRIAAFQFRLASRKTPNAQAEPRQASGHKLGNNALVRQLSAPLQEQSQAQDHLWEYLQSLPVNEIGIPEYQPRLTRNMSDGEHRNLIYPVGKGVFVHLRPDANDSRDIYNPIEPSLNPSLIAKMDLVNKQLINYVEELKKAGDGEQRTQVLLDCLSQICSVNGGRRGGAVQVTEKEMEGLKYLMVRDKQGLGSIDPLISDPYIEDISCSGVGTLFVEHKIFGGLKASITFETGEELDRFVIMLSEKIGRPVTVREPIVDATLPDGSRVNIVYGGDVSKRGSNFTIRKFSTTPMSILDLIDIGTLSYEMAAYISLMLGEGMNTFVSGETASGKTTLLNASVTMFDLLRAALRQRPNEISIGEIRGEEGAIAFQAMQTGHACMATFHAASVEKLIQRLTGNPINIPKTYIDNLNMVVIMSAVRLPDGRPGRRVLSINEIVEYDPESNSFGFIEVFRWDAATDTFEFPGYMNTNLLEYVVAVRRGIPPGNSRQIYEEIENRADVLRKLHERQLTNFYEFHNVLSQAYREGLFR